MRVVWTPPANRTLAKIVDYVAERNPEAAKQLLTDIRGTGERIGDFPYKNRNRDNNIRIQWVSGNSYGIHYRIKFDSKAQVPFVAILKVRHGSTQE